MQDALMSFGAAQWGGGAPSVMIRDNDQRLCEACRSGDFDAAKKALEDGANSSVQFRLALGEITPIFLCASKGYKDIAALLLAHGARLDRKMDFDGTICLHHAASNDQPEMCQFLVEKGCAVNHTDKLGRTPLMDAAEIGSLAVISVLVANGAEVDAEDREHHTSLSYAIDFVSKRDPQYFKAAVALVIQHGANPNYPGKFANRTLLHCAAATGDLDLVRKLVEIHGAAPNVYDNEMQRPLNYALQSGHEEVARFLEEAGMNGGECCCTVL